jgi:hypothetical protein
VNFRQLCQDLVEELGISGGTGPNTVENQTGEYANVVRWIAESSLWIDNLWRDWKYLWVQYETTLTGQSIATGAREIDRSSVWINAGTYTARQLEWQEWRLMRETLNRTPVTGTPVYFSVDPAGTLFLDRPVTSLPIRLEFWKRPTRLVADNDEPDLPEEYHRIIICRAAIMYGNREAAAEVISGMEAEYIDLLEKLQSDQLEPFRNERMAGQDTPLYLRHP